METLEEAVREGLRVYLGEHEDSLDDEDSLVAEIMENISDVVHSILL